MAVFYKLHVALKYDTRLQLIEVLCSIVAFIVDLLSVTNKVMFS